MIINLKDGGSIYLDKEIEIYSEEELEGDFSHYKLITNVHDAETFNYQSDYWGDAENYKQDNIDLANKIVPHIDEEAYVNYHDERDDFIIKGLLIDKQYNATDHSVILIEYV